jgi:hypothetical protein
MLLFIAWSVYCSNTGMPGKLVWTRFIGLGGHSSILFGRADLGTVPPVWSSCAVVADEGKRAKGRASKCNAQPDEQPGRPGPVLLGLFWESG